MYPAGAPTMFSHSELSGHTVGASEFGFKRLHFKNLDPTSVRAEVQVVKTPWTFSLIPALPSGPLIDPYYVWNKILVAYTRCVLTKEYDKLVAISGVAKVIQGMTRDDYFAGMWRRHLEYHLLWNTHQLDTERTRPKIYVAPSWSWASMIGRIEPFICIRPDVPTMIQILDIKVQTVASDIMGQVSGGSLRLRGWLKRFPTTMGKPKTRLGMPDIVVPQLAEMIQFDEHQVRQILGTLIPSPDIL